MRKGDAIARIASACREYAENEAARPCEAREPSPSEHAIPDFDPPANTGPPVAIGAVGIKDGRVRFGSYPDATSIVPEGASFDVVLARDVHANMAMRRTT